MAETLYLNTMPHSDRLWKEIGSNFDNAEQCTNELIDNSISNIIASNAEIKKIEITIEQPTADSEVIILTVEDSGTGLQNPEQAMTLFESGMETTRNEHGLGWKQALSAANPDNDNWDIYERTDSLVSEKKYVHIHAPFIMGNQPYEIINESEEKWPGHQWGKTIFKVACDYRLFQNIEYKEDALKLYIPINFKNVADVIYENIGFVYANILRDEKIDITLTYKLPDQPAKSKLITPLFPVWSECIQISNPDLKIECITGCIRKLNNRSPFNNTTSSIYYKENMASSGVEIRLNGRLIRWNVLKEIYGIQNHPQYNKFLAQINIISEYPDDLPKTTTMKNGFRIGEQKLCEIYDWIKNNVPLNRAEPKRKHKPKVTEKQCADKLAAILEQKYSDDFELSNEGPVVTRECPLFDNIVKTNPPHADIFVKLPGKDQIYECKRDTAKSRDLYQTMEYSDGYELKYGKKLQEVYLVADNFPEDIRRIAGFLNKKNVDLYPEIKLATWNEFENDFKNNLLQERQKLKNQNRKN